jgi:peptidoglycan hydrolase-like protein with peptidoglycan-binding domain
MSAHIHYKLLVGVFALAMLASPAVLPDELTARVQKDLVTLGYDPGNIDGEVTTETTIAIAKFQAERDIPVNGEVSPLLAGVLAAEIDKQRSGAATATTAQVAATRTPEEIEAAQDECLRDAIAKAQQKRKKRRGFGKLVSAVSRTASQVGSDDIADTARGVNMASATSADLSQAAEDLGLSEDEIAACQNLQ